MTQPNLKPMRLLIDLQACQNGSRLRGIGRYTFALAKAIVRNAPQHEVFLLLNGLFPESIDEIQRAFDGLLPQERIIVFDAHGPVDELRPENSWRRQSAEILRESMIARLEPDAVLVGTMVDGGMDNTVVSYGWIDGVPVQSAVLYDLIPMMDPDRYIGWEPAYRWYMNKIESLRRCDVLLAISRSAQQEAQDHLKAPSVNVVNISTAADEDFIQGPLPPDGGEMLCKRLRIDRPYLMHSGNVEPRKNFQGLIEAFGLLTRALQKRYQLVLVGKHSAETRSELEHVASRCGIAPGTVVLTGHVSDSELRALYSRCSLFVFPSLHEGFGLPALEAMHFGVPTIGSNTTSIPEVIGLEAATFDPTSPAAIAALITRALTDDEFRDELLQNAARQADRFNWDGIALTAVGALEEAWKKKGSPAFDTRMTSDQWQDYVLSQLVALPDAPTPNEDEMLVVAKCLAINELRVAHAQARQKPLNWRVEGPFDSSYSLAVVNREAARGLASLGHHVTLHSTEGPGDFPANPAFLQANLDLAEMHARTTMQPHERCDVVSRNLYPPRVADMASPTNLLHTYAWEESGFPGEWIDDFNKHLQGITCVSTHVQKVFQDNGLRIPTASVGDGVDHWERVHASDARFGGKAFRLLHVSSCFPRKGVDILLKAYGRAFSREDNVSLLIKTFANPHNDIHAQLAECNQKNPNYPDVELIEGDLSDADLKALYSQCHVLVAPSRAEGFGLPLAEAMLSGLPVITTGWGGQLDFCNADNSWLLDYQFAPAQTHFNVLGSVWAEPDVESLVEAMQRAKACSAEERRRRAQAGRDVLMAFYKWTDVSARAVAAVQAWKQAPASNAVKTAWVTTWNTKCGIASYSRHLIDAAQDPVIVLAPRQSGRIADDEAFVERCWDSGKEGNHFGDLSAKIETLGIEALVVQFNYGFFEFSALNRFLQQQVDLGRTVIVTMHSTGDPPELAEWDENWRLETVAPALARCARVLVHSIADLNRLKKLGMTRNVALFPLPLYQIKAKAISAPATPRDVPLISTFGYCLPHKGIPEIVEAVALLRKRGVRVKLQLLNAEYPDPVSRDLVKSIQEQVTKHGLGNDVTLLTDYFSDEATVEKLAAADLLVFPYQRTQESASAAVRHGMAAARPTLVTPIPIFDELGDCVLRASGTSPIDLANAIESFLRRRQDADPELQVVADAARAWRKALDVRRLAVRLSNLIASVSRASAYTGLHFKGSSRWLRSGPAVISNRGERVISGQGEIALHGPYIELNTGLHAVEVLYSLKGGGPSKVVVVSHRGSQILATKELVQGENMSARIGFKLDARSADVEIQLTVAARAQAVLHAVTFLDRNSATESETGTSGTRASRTKQNAMAAAG